MTASFWRVGVYGGLLQRISEEKANTFCSEKNDTRKHLVSLLFSRFPHFISQHKVSHVYITALPWPSHALPCNVMTYISFYVAPLSTFLRVQSSEPAIHLTFSSFIQTGYCSLLLQLNSTSLQLYFQVRDMRRPHWQPPQFLQLLPYTLIHCLINLDSTYIFLFSCFSGLLKPLEFCYGQLGFWSPFFKTFRYLDVDRCIYFVFYNIWSES